MKAIRVLEPGGPEVLRISEVPAPEPKAGELLVRIKAAALNRADLMQRRGLYPPPEGATDILGLEMAGEIEQIGEGVSGWSPGDRVCALLPGGGYAEKVVIPADLAIPIPSNLSDEEAAAIPEVFLTAYMNLTWLGRLQPGQSVLIHAGASGVGTAAIQLVREMKANALVTAGSEVKLQRCVDLGAQAGWNYHEGSFTPFVMQHTDNRGVDLILDFIGAPYLSDNLSSLARGGKLIVIGTMGGANASEFNMSQLLMKSLQIMGTTLRSQSLNDKIRLTQEFASFALPLFEEGKLKPIVDKVFPWEEASEAHRYMETNRNIGKIVLRISE